MAVIRVHGGALNSQTLAGGLRYFEIVGGSTSCQDIIGDRGQRVAEFSIVSGGINFVAGDVGSTLSVTGGTQTTPATFTIAAVAGGAITRLTQLNAGVYSVIPANPVATSGGTGTGCTLQLVWSSTIIIPGTDSYVGAGKPVPRSTAEQICEVVQQKATIVQIALMPVDADRFQVALANDSIGWGNPKNAQINFGTTAGGVVNSVTLIDGGYGYWAGGTITITTASGQSGNDDAVITYEVANGVIIDAYLAGGGGTGYTGSVPPTTPIAVVDIESETNATSVSFPADTAGELELALQALGTITVPDDTSTGTTYDLSSTTVDETFLSQGFN